METERVKAVEGVLPKKGKGRTTGGRCDKKWSVRFLEALMDELQEQEEEEERREKVRGESVLRPGWDTLELSEPKEGALACERYEDIIGAVRLVGNWKSNVLYLISNAVMRDYYDGKLGERGVGELFGVCYQKCIERKDGTVVPGKNQYEILGTIYEFFSRANARGSVLANEREGRALVEGCGLHWAGTTYYNSEYFYLCANMQCRFQALCNRISAECGLEELAFERIRDRTQFLPVGGLDYHGVFVWVQRKDNYPDNQYGMKNQNREPPKNFTYLYRNHCSENELPGLRFLARRMKEETARKSGDKRLWREYTVQDGKDYHNGMSYLLEGSLVDEQDERMYDEALGFLQNFRLYRVDGCVELLHVAEKSLFL